MGFEKRCGVKRKDKDTKTAKGQDIGIGTLFNRELRERKNGLTRDERDGRGWRMELKSEMLNAKAPPGKQ